MAGLAPVIDPIAAQSDAASGSAASSEAALGGTIPLSFGRRVVQGKMLWSGPARSGNGNQVIDFAVSFGYLLPPTTYTDAEFNGAIFPNAKPVQEIANTSMVRMWADGALVYDSSDPSGLLNYGGVTVTFYPGRPTQDPDPTIAAVEGLENTPAFRDMLYAVVKNFPLNQLGQGQRIPAIRAELVDQGAIVPELEHFTLLDSAKKIIPYSLRANYTIGSLYGWSNITTPQPTLHEFDIFTRQEIAQYPIVSPNFAFLRTNLEFAAIHDRDNGLIITQASQSGANSQPIIALRLDSGLVIANHGGEGNEINYSNDFAPWAYGGDIVKARANGLDYYGVLLSSVLQCFGLYNYKHAPRQSGTVGITPYGGKVIGNDLSFEFGGGGDLRGIGRSVCAYPLVGRKDIEEQYGLDSTVKVGFYAFIAAGDSVTLVRGLPQGDGKLVIDLQDTTFIQSVGSFAQHVFVDPHDHNLCVLWSEDNVGKNTRIVKYPIELSRSVTHGFTLHLGGAPIYNRSVPLFFPSSTSTASLQYSRLDAGVLGYASPPDWVMIDLATGAQTISDVDGLVGSVDALLFDSVGRNVYTNSLDDSNIRPSRLRADFSVNGSTPLASALRWLAMRAGYESSDIDVDDIGDIVIGGLIETSTDVRSILSNAARVFGFDYFEGDGKIKFVPHVHDGSDLAVYSLKQGDLVPTSSGDEKDTLVTTIAAPEEVPSDAQVVYYDPALNYSVSAQTFKKTRFPFDDGMGNALSSYSVPFVMDGRDALTRAGRIAFNTRAASLSHSTRLPFRYARIEPSDVLNLDINGFEYKLRLTEVVYNSDWSISVSGLEDGYRDDVEVNFNPHVDRHPIPLAGPSDSDAALLETNLLNPDDAPPSPTPLFYVGAQGRGQAWWRGATVQFKDTPTSQWRLIEHSTESVGWGVASTMLPAPANPNEIQADATLDVVCRTIDTTKLPEAISESLFLAGGNSALVGQDGRWEVIYWREVEVVAPRLIRLKGLLRGRRGTDVHCAVHEIGDRFILLRTSTAAPDEDPLLPGAESPSFTFEMPLTPVPAVGVGIGDEVQARAVGDNTITPADIASRVATGEYAKPWAPCAFTATRVAGDLNLTWERRTRLSGPWQNGTGEVPLDEETEEYELEILSEDGATILRIVTGLSARTYAYTAAEQAADSFDPGDFDHIRIRVYQMSAYVGRGHPGEQTVYIRS